MGGLLGLNMIVGPGEHEELDRCLESFEADNNFEKIVIVNTSNDGRIDEVVKKWGGECHHFEWHSERYPYGDFAGARNMALDNTDTTWVMWLDADDICDPNRIKSMRKARSVLEENIDKEVDAFFMGYALIVTDDLKPQVLFMRERIFRNNAGFRWKYPVHEQLCQDWTKVKHALFKGFNIIHLPAKPTFVSAERNVRILRHEMEKRKHVPVHIKYFYGRDMMMSGKIEEGVKILSNIVESMENSYENIYAIAIDIASYYAYGALEVRPTLEKLQMENQDNIERWLRMAIACNARAAEPLVIIGDLYRLQGHRDSAERVYRRALSCKMGSGMIQAVPYYEETPARRLADIYVAKKEYEQALWYNKRAIEHIRDDELVQRRIEILSILLEECGVTNNANADKN